MDDAEIINTGRYRVRRGLFGSSVLQELKSRFGEYKWFDVNFSAAPESLAAITNK